ncbi:ATP-binding protein [Actinophytocola sp.]|uniref:ATP-binding protein n=1 Tax=Actinophytocola sp. TaxID=1872138 RepID=UPI002ED4BCAE
MGRERELRTVDSLLAGAEERGTALVIRGEAGIGKSALVAQASRHALDLGMRVLTAVGVRSETYLPFAGLHQLLRPLLGEFETRSTHRHDAVLAALGVLDAPAPDLFRIALATLDMVTSGAAVTPILLVADDVQWLDRPTCDVLAFVARRLESDPVVLLATCRDEDTDDNPLDAAGLAELRLAPLDAVDATALLDAQDAGLDPAVRQRVLVEASGNPLALVELPLAAQHLDAAALPTWLPLTTRLEQSFAVRVSGLPSVTRALLLVAALDEGEVLAEILTAAGTMTGCEVTVPDLAPAISARLLAVDTEQWTVRFRHPLIRSAIRQLASVSQRHVGHAALAETLVAQPDRRVWHLAAAAVGRDELVAAELEATAARARRRGAIAVAADALERAVRLGDDPARHGARLLRATEIAFELGRHDAVLRLLAEIDRTTLAPRERTRLSWLREVRQGGWSGTDRVAAFVEAADRMRLAGDPDRALEALLAVALRCWWSNPDQETRDLVVTSAELVRVPPQDPRRLAVQANTAPVERGEAVLTGLTGLRPGAGDPELDHLLGTAAGAVGAFPLTVEFLAAAVAGLRRQGRLALLAQALVSQAWAGVNLGRTGVALPSAEEAYRLSIETDQPLWAAVAQLAMAVLAGRRGDADAAEDLAARAEQVLLPVGANPMLALVALARGTAALGAGRHSDAYEQLRQIFDPNESWFHPLIRSWAVVDLVDGAVHSGRHDAARTAVATLEPLLARTGSPVLGVGLWCARPLVAADADAEAAFRTGLDADLTHWPFHRARLLLAHGAWLRRQRRAAESRVSLRAARESFDLLGALPWGDRARRELNATGERSRRRTPGALDRLTPQELQIAQLAATGLTNREIAERLYLSHRTVSTHLYRIFPKLGVTSRTELAAAVYVT